MSDNQRNTYVTQVDLDQPDPQVFALATKVLQDGGLVAFPTETVYGLGANALDADAVQKIFAAKERPANDPLIVHIHNREQLQHIAIDIPDEATQLMDTFWAGALTVVLPKHPNVPPVVTAGQDTVAVRMPNHPIALELLRESNLPIAAPSANRFSRPSPTSAYHVLQDLNGRVDVILDGGNTTIGIESTIVDMTAPVPIVLRPGGISLEQLREVIPTIAFRPRRVGEDETAPAPGTLLKHYSPDAQMMVFEGNTDAVFERMKQVTNEQHSAGKHVGILVLDDHALRLTNVQAQIVLLGDDLDAMASNLFAGIRELDTAEVDVILVRAPEQAGVGLALHDRLLRAAEGQIIAVIS